MITLVHAGNNDGVVPFTVKVPKDYKRPVLYYCDEHSITIGSETNNILFIDKNGDSKSYPIKNPRLCFYDVLDFEEHRNGRTEDANLNSKWMCIYAVHDDNEAYLVTTHIQPSDVDAAILDDIFRPNCWMYLGVVLFRFNALKYLEDKYDESLKR